MSENRGPALSATSDVPIAPTTEVAPAAAVETAIPATTPTTEAALATTTTETPAATLTSTPEPRPVAERISQLVSQRREADARAASFEARANDLSDKLERAIAALQTKPSPTNETNSTSTDFDPRPSRDAFTTPEEFESALVTWAGTRAATQASAELRKLQEEQEAARAEQARIDAEQKIEQDRRAADEARARELQTAWETRRAKAIEAHPDFTEVVEVDSLPISLTMGHVIATRDDGPDIAYYLGKNPQEAVRIASLTVPGQVFPANHPQAGLPIPNAIEQAFEMGKIAARFGTQTSATPAPTTTTITTSVPVLPAPPNPITGANANATSRTIEEVGNEGSMEEYAAKRLQQLATNRRPGQRTLLQ